MVYQSTNKKLRPSYTFGEQSREGWENEVSNAIYTKKWSRPPRELIYSASLHLDLKMESEDIPIKAQKKVCAWNNGF